MKNITVFILFLLVTSAGFGQKIAILDLKPLGPIATDELQVLSERFRSQVVQTQKFEVMERKELAVLDQEIALQLSDGFSEKAIAAAGQKSGAAFVVVGYVGKIRGTYTIDIRMVNCTTSKIENSFSEDYKGELDGLIGLMEKVAKRMAGIEEKSNLWMYLTGGGVATVVTLAILLTGGDEGPTGLPAPPDPPGN